jgi:conjugal transfer pilus assembly protein TraA
MKLFKSPAVTALVVLSVFAATSAIAGTDATFGSATTGPLGTMIGWLTGSMGHLFAIGALAVGLGVGIVKQSVMSVAVGVGVALAASAGPLVLNSIFTAVL